MSSVEVMPIEILLADSNYIDVELTKAAFGEGGVASNIHVTGDGEDTVLFLKQEGEYSDKPKSDIVLLDYNLPKTNSSEMIEFMKGEGNLRGIPIVMLVSSRADIDVANNHDMYADSYIVKPLDMYKFINALQDIEGFWLDVVKSSAQENKEEKAA